MKKLTIKNCFVAVLATTGAAFTTGCESCSRKTPPGNNTAATMHDTVYIDTCMTPADSLVREGSTGTYVPYGKGTVGTAAPNGSSAGGKATGNTGGRQLTQEEIDDRVENSSSQAIKNGKPVNSGGTSGSGQGTGTGSTGNNSRVTTKEDQLRN
jgi:hypothetical protein